MKPTDFSELKANATAMAARMRVLSHPDRLLMLCRMDEGEVAVNELVTLTGLSQSAVSQHLAMMREDGTVASRGEAQMRYYRLCDPVVSAIIQALCAICAEAANPADAAR